MPKLQTLRDIARDAAGLTGAALLAYGAWRVYPPAGFIVLGLLLLAGSYFNARAE